MAEELHNKESYYKSIKDKYSDLSQDEILSKITKFFDPSQKEYFAVHESDRQLGLFRNLFYVDNALTEERDALIDIYLIGSNGERAIEESYYVRELKDAIDQLMEAGGGDSKLVEIQEKLGIQEILSMNKMDTVMMSIEQFNARDGGNPNQDWPERFTVNNHYSILEQKSKLIKNLITADVVLKAYKSIGSPVYSFDDDKKESISSLPPEKLLEHKKFLSSLIGNKKYSSEIDYVNDIMNNLYIFDEEKLEKIEKLDIDEIKAIEEGFNYSDSNNNYMKLTRNKLKDIIEYKENTNLLAYSTALKSMSLDNINGMVNDISSESIKQSLEEGRWNKDYLTLYHQALKNIEYIQKEELTLEELNGHMENLIEKRKLLPIRLAVKPDARFTEGYDLPDSPIGIETNSLNTAYGLGITILKDKIKDANYKMAQEMANDFTFEELLTDYFKGYNISTGQSRGFRKSEHFGRAKLERFNELKLSNPEYLQQFQASYNKTNYEQAYSNNPEYTEIVDNINYDLINESSSQLNGDVVMLVQVNTEKDNDEYTPQYGLVYMNRLVFQTEREGQTEVPAYDEIKDFVKGFLPLESNTFENTEDELFIEDEKTGHYVLESDEYYEIEGEYDEYQVPVRVDTVLSHYFDFKLTDEQIERYEGDESKLNILINAANALKYTTVHIDCAPYDGSERLKTFDDDNYHLVRLIENNSELGDFNIPLNNNDNDRKNSFLERKLEKDDNLKP